MLSPSESSARHWIRASAIAGFLGVALGAFGAHGLKSILTGTGGIPWWETATQYHLVHAVAALASVAWLRSGRAAVLFLAGIAVFSGSLYVMALTGVRWLGAVTPIGGVLFLLGWLRLAFARPADSPETGSDRL